MTRRGLSDLSNLNTYIFSQKYSVGEEYIMSALIFNKFNLFIYLLYNFFKSFSLSYNFLILILNIKYYQIMLNVKH